MSQIIRKKCNGANKHDNDFKLSDLVSRTSTVRELTTNSRDEIPEQIVMKCRTCTEGRVVFTRSELEKIYGA